MIALTKIPHSKLQIIAKAMLSYVICLQCDTMQDSAKNEASIITELYHDKVKNMLNKQYPSKKHKLSLAYHQATTLLKAFMHYQKVCDDYLENSVIETLKTELHRQVI